MKTIILLAAFRENYPTVREDIAKWILDNPEESQLKELMFEILHELGPK